ncbi:hypothetical protein Ddc_23655 [Ditylenchus destructor]|nr:hypothetical protein Ddc_23655 [Ditylenchus destructor]
MAPTGNNNFASPFSHPRLPPRQQRAFTPVPSRAYNADFPTVIRDRANADATSQLNQEICNLKSSLKLKSELILTLTRAKENLREQCAKLYSELHAKDSELKAEIQVKEQSFRDQSSLKEQLAKLKVDHHNDLLHEAKKHKVKVEQAQNEKDSLSKKLAEIQRENRELKQTNEQSFRDQTSLREQLAKMKADHHKDLLQEAKKYKVRVEQAQNEKDSLSKKLAEIQRENLNVGSRKCWKSIPDRVPARVRHEPGKPDRARDRSQLNLKQLQTEDTVKANEIANLNETMAKTKIDYDRRIKDFSSLISKLNKENKKLEEENEMLKANCGSGISDQLNFDLNTCRAQLESCRANLQKEKENMNTIVVEMGRLKADLAIANETIEISVERSAKLGLKLKIQEDKCKEHLTDSAQSQNLKAELKNVKKAHEDFRADHKKLQHEANRLHNFVHRKWKDEYMKELPFIDDQVSSNDEDDSDDDMSPSSAKKKRKSK